MCKPGTYPILDRVDSPSDLRVLPRPAGASRGGDPRLPDHTVCQTGGHLAASLGTVELTLAIHYVFDTPEDRLVWDVGHQAYPTRS